MEQRVQSIPEPLPVCLSIAGSDSGGGAGIQADLRTFYCCGCYGLSAITCVTAQSPQRVSSIYALPVGEIVAQIQALTAAFTIHSIKTGMLFSAEIIHAVAAALSTSRQSLVVDPVMVASSGSRLLQDDAIEVLQKELVPRARVVTPNIPEAEVLLGRSLHSASSCRDAALELSTLGCAVLLKGGHRAVQPGCDWYAEDGMVYSLEAPTLTNTESHGTGCTLSSALAAYLAIGHEGLQAAVAAKAFVWQSLNNPRQLGPRTFGMWPYTPVETRLIKVSDQ